MPITSARYGRPKGTGVDDSRQLESLAALLTANPALKPADIDRILQSTAVDLGTGAKSVDLNTGQVTTSATAWDVKLDGFTVRASAAPCLRVRPSPDATAPQFACIVPGTQVTAVGVAPFWRQVRLPDGRVGWAAKKYLEPTATGIAADTDLPESYAARTGRPDYPVVHGTRKP